MKDKKKSNKQTNEQKHTFKVDKEFSDLLKPLSKEENISLRSIIMKDGSISPLIISGSIKLCYGEEFIEIKHNDFLDKKTKKQGGGNERN